MRAWTTKSPPARRPALNSPPSTPTRSRSPARPRPLPPGDAASLFEPYEQRSADRSGLGLGLSICLRGARAIGGDLRVRDRPGIGCVFSLELRSAIA